TTSELAAYIDYRYWGTEVTLRLLAKIIQREIFVVVAPSGLDDASYLIFQPDEVENLGETFSSVKERNYEGKKPKGWIKRLQ
ncbi:hypothetical protein PHYSODRAFT_372842, partial [Phytophthora sojae]